MTGLTMEHGYNVSSPCEGNVSSPCEGRYTGRQVGT